MCVSPHHRTGAFRGSYGATSSLRAVEPFHILLGTAVAVVSLVAGVGAFTPRGEERFWGTAGLAHGLLGLQVASGFFLMTNEPMSAAHAGPPVAALAGILVVRANSHDRPKWVVASSLLGFAGAAVAFAPVS